MGSAVQTSRTILNLWPQLPRTVAGRRLTFDHLYISSLRLAQNPNSSAVYRYPAWRHHVNNLYCETSAEQTPVAGYQVSKVSPRVHETHGSCNQSRCPVITSCAHTHTFIIMAGGFIRLYDGPGIGRVRAHLSQWLEGSSLDLMSPVSARLGHTSANAAGGFISLMARCRQGEACSGVKELQRGLCSQDKVSL
jgi:hypothetical protein